MDCIKCRANLDSQLEVNAKKVQPKPGDMSICFYCGNVAIFTEGGIREPNIEEQVAIMEDPDVKQALAMIDAFNRL